MNRFLTRAPKRPKTGASSSSSSSSSSSTSSSSTTASIFGFASSAASPSVPLRDPTTIITWNANGLIPRIKGDLDALRAMVRDRDPDVVCLQEARVKAYTSNPKAKVSSSDRRMRGRPLGDEWRGALEKALTLRPKK